MRATVGPGNPLVVLATPGRSTRSTRSTLRWSARLLSAHEAAREVRYKLATTGHGGILDALVMLVALPTEA